MYGARISLLVGLASVALRRWCWASALGLLAGYVGGKIDAFIMRVADVQLSFPAILIALLIDGVRARGAAARRARSTSRVLVLMLAIGALQLGAVRAHGARLDDGGEEQGVRPGRARHRRLALAASCGGTCCRT